MSQPMITLPGSPKVLIPQLGLGVYKSPPGEVTFNACLWALQGRYRHIDTATLYHNEADVGRAVRECGLKREEVFVTTKLWNDAQDKATEACLKSLELMGLEYVDLYLMHSPMNKHRVKAWQDMCQLKKMGKVRAIGVSNFGIAHLHEFKALGLEPPAVNQIEVHPFLQRRELVKYCEDNGIVVQAYSPMAKAQKLDHPVLLNIASMVHRTPADVMIRWSLQKGYVSLPKSVNKDRIEANTAALDFELSGEAMEALDALEQGLCTGWDPTKRTIDECNSMG